MTDETSWEALDRAEGITSKPRETHSKVTAAPTSPSPAGHLQEGDSHNAGGIASALARRSTVNHAKAVLKAVYIWPEEQVRPLSWQPPASWGPPRTVWRITVHGLPVDSMFYENGEHVRRAAFKTHGYDN